MTAITFYTAADHIAASIRILQHSTPDAETREAIKDLQSAYSRLTGAPYREPVVQQTTNTGDAMPTNWHELMNELFLEYQSKLPVDERYGESELCYDKGPDGYTCTRAWGHKGDHIAHGVLTVVARWSA